MAELSATLFLRVSPAYRAEVARLVAKVRRARTWSRASESELLREAIQVGLSAMARGTEG